MEAILAKIAKMEITATLAKNRFGHMLDQSQHEPVFIEKSGRQVSVMLSMQEYKRLLQAQQLPQATQPTQAASAAGSAFYAQHKEWVDWQNQLVEDQGVFGQEYRVW
jgi:prevent-host-death family protein